MKPKIIYYENELEDDFSGFQRKKIRIDQSYVYERGWLWRGVAFLLYPCVRFAAYLYMRLGFHLKIINRKILKKYKREGYFLYANHTHAPADGFLPSLVCYPKHVHILVTSENLSVRGTKNILAMLGATPIPHTLQGMKHFKAYIHTLMEKGRVVMIYPEAHIWPYYTKIRPFTDTSFAYPYFEQRPVFTFTVTYQKKKRRIRMTCYIDGPFYPTSTSKKEAIHSLREQAYQAMVERSKQSSYEKIKYIKRESEKK